MLLMVKEGGGMERVLLDPAATQACHWCQQQRSGLGQVVFTPQAAQGHQHPVPSLPKLVPTGILASALELLGLEGASVSHSNLPGAEGKVLKSRISGTRRDAPEVSNAAIST